MCVSKIQTASFLIDSTILTFSVNITTTFLVFDRKSLNVKYYQPDHPNSDMPFVRVCRQTEKWFKMKFVRKKGIAGCLLMPFKSIVAITYNLLKENYSTNLGLPSRDKEAVFIAVISLPCFFIIVSNNSSYEVRTRVLVI